MYSEIVIIDGKKIAEEMLAEVAEEVNKLPKKPRLAAVLVSSQCLEVEPLNIEVQPLLNGPRKFLELKKKAAEKVGIDFRFYEFPSDVTTQKLRKEVVKIARAGVNHGVLVELPLPTHLNVQYILNAIPPEKDVDVLSEKAQGAFFVGRSPVLPPAVEAVKQIFLYNDISLCGKNCAVFGYGLLVGRQVSHWLASQGATVLIINEFTQNPKQFTLNPALAGKGGAGADIIISGVGKAGIIKADMVKEGAIVIDFGTAETQNAIRNTERKIVGDVEFEEVSKKAGLITPVPGGVGPIVVAAVLKNLISLAKDTK